MPALYAFVDSNIRRLEQRLREYLSGEIPAEALVRDAQSVVHDWEALPEEARQGPPEAHEDVLWHAVGTTRQLAEREPGRESVSPALLHECLHLLQSRMPVPQHYVARRP